MSKSLSFANKVRLTLIIVLQFMLVEVYAKKGKKKRTKNSRQSRFSKDSVDYSTPLYMMMFLMVCIFAPVLGTFAHSVYKDPLTPKVMQGIWDYVKDRSTGYLSGDKVKDKGPRED
jgi:ABC-type Fe3+ transport system permease subunit